MKAEIMYDQFADDYDRFVNWNNRLAFEIPFIDEQLITLAGIDKSQFHILDAACGTGMHAIALAKQGYHVSGADISSEMVLRAKENALNQGLSLDFRVASFGNLFDQFGRETYKSVLCLGNSLPHIPTKSALAEVLLDFYNLLKPSGLLILQNRNFDKVVTDGNRWMEPQTYSDEKNEWIFQRFYDFEVTGLIRFNIVTLKRLKGSDWHVNITSTQLMPLFLKDMIAKLKEVGFTSIEALGSLSHEPFDPNTSENLVLIVKK